MASGNGQVYYCHQCERTVRPASPADLVCPDCHGGFLEEWSGSVADGPPSPGGNINLWDYMRPGSRFASEEGPGGYHAFQGLVQRPRGNSGNSPALSQLLEAMSTFFQQMQTTQVEQGLGQDAEGDAEVDGEARIRAGTDMGAINPMLLLRGQMQNILGDGNVEFFIDNGTGAEPRRLPGNIGDYFFGPFEQLIQQLAENDPNRYGTPPASKSAVKELPTINISKEHLGTDAAQCAVCKDEFALCTEVKQMPCKHMYHPDCILPWLAQHNSCPVCRYELPTDDLDYEQARARGIGVSSGNVSPGAQGEGERGPGGFSIGGLPGQFTRGRFPAGSDGRVDNSGVPNVPANAGTSGSPQGGYPGEPGGGGFGGGRRFSMAFPSWFRGPSTTSQSPANAQAESSGQTYSAETVSSGPVGEQNDTPGQTSRASRTDDDCDTLMSEARQEDLD